MSQILRLALLTIVVASLAVAQESGAKPSNKKQGAGAQDEIKKLEEERNQAILHADTAALDRMTSDDYTLINQRGELIKKAQILDGFKSGAIKFDSRELSDLNVRVYGNVTQKSTENGKDTS